MALVGEELAAVARLLDEAEYLIATLRDGDVALFAQCVTLIAQAHPDLSNLRSAYDEMLRGEPA